MIYKNFNFLEKSFGAQHSKIELGLIIPSFFQFCCQRKVITGSNVKNNYQIMSIYLHFIYLISIFSKKST